MKNSEIQVAKPIGGYQEIAAPPPIAQWSVLISLSIAAVGWFAPRLWQAWDRKEVAESDLNRSLVDDLRANNAQIVQDLRSSHAEILEAIALKASIETLMKDLQTVIGAQSIMFADFAGLLADMNQKLDKYQNILAILESSHSNDIKQSGPFVDRSQGNAANRGE